MNLNLAETKYDLQIGRSSVGHLVGTFLFPHGTWVYSQIHNLNRWRPIVLTGKTQNLDVFPQDPIYSLDGLPKRRQLTQKLQRRILGYFPFWKDAIRDEQVRVLHAHFGPVGYASLRLARTTHIPLITTFYGYDLSRLPKLEPKWQKNYRELFTWGQAFLVEGPYMREQLLRLGCPEEKAHVQRLGVDLSCLTFEPRHLSDDGLVRVLIAATFTEKKGLVYAVEAFCRLCELNTQVRLTIIGDARNRPDEQAIKRDLVNMISKYRVTDKVTFLGYQPYSVLVEQFYQHHIFLSPSVQAVDGDNEGGAPVTIIEASASGMPIVSTTHCDIPSVVNHGHSGILVAERNVNALVDALAQLAQAPEQWPEIGYNGHHYIEQNYDVRQTVAQLEDRYDSLLY